MKYISITFDDGREDNYLYAYPMMKKYGLVGTVFCTTGFIDGTWKKPDDWISSGNPIKIEQLKALQNSGWEIALHGDKHTTEVQDMHVSLKKFKNWGFKGPFGFSMPNSKIEDYKLNSVIEQYLNKEIMYIRKGRKIDTKKIDSKILFGLSKYVCSQYAYNKFNNENLNCVNNADNENIYSVVIRNEDDPKMVIKFIEQMPDESWCVLMLHSIWPQKHKLEGSDPWNWSLEKFRYFCSGLKSLKCKNRIKVLTVKSQVEKNNQTKFIEEKNSMEVINNKVFVWSIDDFNTLGLMRELGQFNLDMTFLIKGKAGIATKSKFCKKYIETDTIQEGIEYLNNINKQSEYKPIVIISSDEIVTYVDLHREEFQGDFILPITKAKGNIAKYIDKNTMTKLASEIGFLCPKSEFIKWNSDITNIEYPCLIKPSHQKLGHYNEFKFKICNNYSELKNTLRFVRHDSEFILQQYIQKELDVLVYGARMRDGNVVLAGAMIRDRWVDSGSSSHGYLTNEIPKCINTQNIVDFVNTIDYFGLFSVEYGMMNNQAYFFEINLRNDGTSHYFFQAGANLPLAYVYSCAGLDYSKINTIVKNEKYFIDEVFDIENVLKRNITKDKWKADLHQASIYKYYDTEDLEPWQVVKKTKNKQIMKDLILKKYRLYIVAMLDRIGLKK